MTDFQTVKLIPHLVWKLCCRASCDPDSNSSVTIPRNYCHLVL